MSEMAEYTLGNSRFGRYDWRHFKWLYAGSNYYSCGVHWSEADISATLPSLTFTQDESEEYSPLYNDIQTYVDEHLMGFMMGIRPMEEWDAFVQGLVEDLNIERCLEIQQAAYDRYISR